MTHSTFVALSLLFFSFITFPIPAQDIIVDNDAGAPGYTETGTWSTSSGGYNGGVYRFSDSSQPPSAAIWRPDLPSETVYEVTALYRRGTNRAFDARFTISHADGMREVRVNGNGDNTLSSSRLGEWMFPAGTAGSVTLTNEDGPGLIIADAIRFSVSPNDAPVIADILRRPFDPVSDVPVHVMVRVTDDRAALESVILKYNTSPSGPITTLPMLDDGASFDKEAGDGFYGATISPQPDGATIAVEIEATDSFNFTQSLFSYMVNDATPREYRCIWADTWGTSILNQSQVDNFVQTIRDANLNTIIIEIRKIGDAYYLSNVEPRATNITGGVGFDPLQYLIDVCHDTSGGKQYIEVHGWFVANRISRSETLSPLHVLAQHPDYIMSNSTGATVASGTMFLDPGHPGSADHNVAAIVDCVKNYQIDGINLDYIRYPEYTGSWGYNPVSVARFNARYGKSGQPATNDPDWADWRRENVSLEVRKIYIKSQMVDPHVILTADTVNWGFEYDNWPASAAYSGVYQDWVGWLQAPILDYNALMGYSTTAGRYTGWMNVSLANDDKRGSIIGIGAYLQSSIQNSMNQLLEARTAGADGLNIYDWQSEVQGSTSGETRTQFYTALKNQLFPERAATPIHNWKYRPAFGAFEGNITAAGVPVDHAGVALNVNPAVNTVSDGSGWFAMLEMTPGFHALRFSAPDYKDIIVNGAIERGGQIVTINVDFVLDQPGGSWWMGY